MKILGIDPGSLHTGYGVIEKQGNRLRVLSQGRFSCKPGAPLSERLAFLSGNLDELLDRWEPDATALEGLFHGVNSRSLIVLAQTRGALLARLAVRNLEIHEFAPAEVKSAVTGNGRAGKDQIQSMVRLLLGLRDETLTADAADALALALCLAQRRRIALLSRSDAPSPGKTRK